MRKLIILATCLALCACGQKAGLELAQGQSLPPTAVRAPAPATPDDLLKLGPQAAPERSVELRRRSEERADDPFDLPPPE